MHDAFEINTIMDDNYLQIKMTINFSHAEFKAIKNI